MSQRKSYTKEFKEEAIRLASQSGVTVVSQDLGIHPNMLYMWKRELEKHAKKAFPGRGNPTEQEFMQLKKDNTRLKEELEILKKAAGIFLRLSGKDTQ